MDFLDPKRQRAHRIRLMIGYGLMAVTLGMATYVLVTITFGYNVDRKTGAIIQNGVFFVGAHPESANILINGQSKGTTDARLTIPAGQYTVQLQRTGYRTWQHGLSLDGGGVERFDYPFLFPEKLVTSDTDLFTAAPGLATESPDRHWFIGEQGSSLTNFDQVDLNATDNTITGLTFPGDLFTAATGAQQLELVEWSTDNRHVLVKHTYNDGAAVEYVMLDRQQPSSSLNISKTFPNVTVSTIMLHDKRFDQLYILGTDGVLTTLDTTSKQTAVVASHVAAFKPSGSDQVLYVTTDGAPSGQLVAKFKDGNNTYILRPVAANTTYLLDLATYNSSQYVVVGAASEGKVYEYKNPLNDLKKTPIVTPIPVALFKIDNPQFVSFSQNTQFVEVQSGSKFDVYDAESDRQYRYDTKLPLDAPAKAAWMDGDRLMVISGGKTVIFDFDGTNLQTLSPASAGYNVFFDRDYTALFNIGPSTTVKDHVSLTRTELKVKH